MQVPGQTGDHTENNLTWFFWIIFGMCCVSIASALILFPRLIPQASLKFLDLFRTSKKTKAKRKVKAIKKQIFTK